jgi:hypothetical protein
MTDWLKHLALTHRVRVRSRAQKSFYFVVKIHENFCISTFLCWNTMALTFFHENFPIKTIFIPPQKFNMWALARNFLKMYHGASKFRKDGVKGQNLKRMSLIELQGTF